MTPDELAAIKARAAAATPGPWEPKSYCGRAGGGVEPFDSTATAGLGFEVEGPPYPMLDRYRFENGLDAVFVAHARTDVPALVAEVERLREMYRVEMGAVLDLIYQGRTVTVRMTGIHDINYVVGLDGEEQTFGEWTDAACWLRLMADRP